VVPGKIYISAMPSYRGLTIEQERLHFRTIINLFDEASTQASPYHDDEIRFVREHNLRYLGSPSDGLESDRFLDETLALAKNPDAWPILVHCHGCMDRSPAWMGIYRFVVEGKPLAEIFAEIERHRGSRPKAVVTLQYNRKLPARAPEHFAADPIARRLSESVAGTRDPFLRPNWNNTSTGRRVITRIDPDPNVRRP
jgi:protein tyrosine/serine phosphatase